MAAQPEELRRAELNSDDFISNYLRTLPESEVPIMFQRWSALVGLGAWIGRDAYFSHMDTKIYPNLYAMLIADSGVRKSTAIKQFTKLMRKAGYTNFAAQKTSKEQFLVDLSQVNISGESLAEAITNSIFATDDLDEAASSNMFAAPDEFNELFGNNILEFVSMLGTLWDFEGVFESKTKHSGGVRIPNPCISLLGGNTPATLYGTFPPETIGQGFFSRVLFIHSPSTGKKIAFPRRMDEEASEVLVDCLREIKQTARGEMKLGAEALELLEECYLTWPGINDIRFASYGNRRFTQLLKLVTIHALADYSHEIKAEHVIRANTVLTKAEEFMPTGLGEFGRAKNSTVVHDILARLEGATEPVSFPELWAAVSKDVDKIRDLQEIISGMLIAKRIISVDTGFLSVKQQVKTSKKHLLDWDYLSNQERELK